MPQPVTSLRRYFDYNGSTPLVAPVRELGAALLEGTFGNASAPHAEGRAARALVERAREQVGGALGAAPEEVIFTSGGTEANNQALFGTAALHPGGHIVLSAIEHASVLNTGRALEARGYELTLVSPGEDGAVQLRDVEQALREDTILVSLMLANNETGVVQPVREVAALCRARGVRFHTDAVCSVGKLPVDVEDLGCDLLSISGHKLYAPKGVGLLYKREGVELAPLHHGCGHQGGLRSGTENTLGVACLGKAFELLVTGGLASEHSLEGLRQSLWNGIEELFPGARRNGAGGCLPNTLNVWFPGIPAIRLQARLAEAGFSVAAGASAGTGKPSHVLRAMGHSPERASESLRFSLGHASSPEGVAELLEQLARAVETERDPAALQS